MEWAETTLLRLGAKLSIMLNPFVLVLDQLHQVIRRQMDQAGFPYEWQVPALTAAWVLVLFMVLRTLTGWWRLLCALVVLLVLSKVYGYLPGA